MPEWKKKKEEISLETHQRRTGRVWSQPKDTAAPAAWHPWWAAALLFLRLLLSVSLCHSLPDWAAAPGEGGKGKGEVPLFQEGGGEEQPVSRDFLYCEKCWPGIKEEKVCRELLAILSFPRCSQNSLLGTKWLLQSDGPASDQSLGFLPSVVPVKPIALH